MNEAYWDRVAVAYDDEIFDVYQSNKGAKLQKQLKKHINKSGFAIDFGCGIGKAFSFLSPSFKQVLAVDISENCINTSKAVVRLNAYANVELKRLDLANPNLRLPACDFGLCINVAILPDLKKNVAIIRNIQKTMKKNATAIFVVPSLESALFSSWRMISWYNRGGTKAEEIPDSEFINISRNKVDTVQGLVKIDGEPTKHYLHPELEAVFSEANLMVSKIEKLEYDWTTEFAMPPKWMQAPYPWDWMVVCKKA